MCVRCFLFVFFLVFLSVSKPFALSWPALCSSRSVFGPSIRRSVASTMALWPIDRYDSPSSSFFMSKSSPSVCNLGRSRTLLTPALFSALLVSSYNIAYGGGSWSSPSTVRSSTRSVSSISLPKSSSSGDFNEGLTMLCIR